MTNRTRTAGNKTAYYAYDGLGSVVNLTSSAGATWWTYAYLPYGGIRTETRNSGQAIDNVLRYTGGYLDPTALYHLGARQYDSGTGRFLSTDPMQPSITDPYVSAYVYANNNPVRYTDPSGRCPITLAADLLLGGVGTLVGPEGTIGGFALGTAIGVALCGAETIVEVSAIKGLVNQPNGDVTPQLKPMPRVTNPLDQPSPLRANPYTGELEPSGGTGGRRPPTPPTPMWKKIAALVAAGLIAGHVEK